MRRNALLAPGLLWLGGLFVAPALLVLGNSFFERGVYGGIDYTFTFENYRRLADPLYLGIFGYSAGIAGSASLIALLIGYPVAYRIALMSPSRQLMALGFVMMPFWSNYLIRTYAWIVLLNREGLINRGLGEFGLISAPLPLLYNDFAIILGLVYSYTPFLVLVVYASISRLGSELREASADLGAGAFATFRRITLPLTWPAIVTGLVFVFVLSIGNFVTPDLLGGGKKTMLGNLIYDQFLTARDWPFGSAISTLLIGVMLILLALQARIGDRRERAA